MMGHIRIGLVQDDFPVGDVTGNVERVIAHAAKARALGAQLAVFPELTLTGYPPEDLLLRPELHQQVELGLTRLQASLPDIDVIVGAPERSGSALYNSAHLLTRQGLRATARKQLLPNYGVFDEKRYFTPGERPCVVDYRGLAIGLTICEDIWAPGPARAAADLGARLLVNLNASPFHMGKGGERESMLAQRATETGCGILYINLLGGQDELVFDGGSLAVAASGEVRLRAPLLETALSWVDVDRDGELVATAPSPEQPAADEALYRALVLGVRDYATKNGFPGAVLGLSGGVDSALTLAIAVDALGADHVEALLMPSRFTAAISLTDAEAEAEALGVATTTLPIEPMVEAFDQVLAPRFAGLARDVTEENIQARIRGMLLMALSNKTGRILLTTGNKSEMAVGYATLYGDMAGGFAPLKDVPKTAVYRLAAWRNRLAGSAVIPERVLTRPPSAELAEDQRDSDSLPPYAVLDPILECYVERDCSIDEIVAQGFDRESVLRVAALVDRSEYKRRQAPPGVRVSRRAFGRDRRYPLTSAFGRSVLYPNRNERSVDPTGEPDDEKGGSHHQAV